MRFIRHLEITAALHYLIGCLKILDCEKSKEIEHMQLDSNLDLLLKGLPNCIWP